MEMERKAHHIALEKTAAAMKGGHHHVHAPTTGFFAQLYGLLTKNVLTRMVFVILPVCVVGLMGALILVATEEPDSAIMTTDDPFVTAFYICIITGISIGYGDFSPSTPTGRGMFSLYIVIAVGVVVSAIGQVELLLRHLVLDVLALFQT